jgi:hypothetical protein
MEGVKGVTHTKIVGERSCTTLTMLLYPLTGKFDESKPAKYLETAGFCQEGVG